MTSLHEFLEKGGFEEDVISIFLDNDIDYDVFLTLSEDDMKEVGIMSFGARRRLSMVIKAANGAATKGYSQHDSSCSDDASITSDLDQPGSSSCQTSPRTTTRMAPSPHTVPSLPMKDNMPLPSKRFSLANWLPDQPGGDDLIQSLKNCVVVSSQQRIRLVKVAVTGLTETLGLYPTASDKTSLAREMVQMFPAVKDTTPGLEGHEHFYNNGSGFLEYKLKNSRMSLPQDKKKRKRRSRQELEVAAKSAKTVVAEDEEEPITPGDQEKVDWMRYSPPTGDNQKKHRDLFIDTFSFRRKIINGSPTITDVLCQFPRLQDMPELINLEFQLLYPDQCDNFISRWGRMKEQIILAGEGNASVLVQIQKFQPDDNRDLCALTALAFALHKSVVQVRGTSTSSSRENSLLFLVQSIPEGTDVEAAAKAKKPVYQQPFLLALGPARRPVQYFAVLDKVAVPCGTSLITAIDRLFKCHFVFNVHYSPALLHFWHFIAAFIYEVLDPHTVKPIIRSFASSVRAVEL